MTGWLVWVRRSTATLLLPAMVAATAVVIASRTGWEFEWGWALSHAGTATLLVGPLVAGAVAFDRARRFEPTLAILDGTTARSGYLPLVGASWLVSVLAWLAGVGYVAIRVKSHQAGGHPDLWLFTQVPVCLLAAATLGFAWGTAFQSPVSAPLAAAAVYLGAVASSFLGLPVLFAAGRATGSLIGREQVPAQAAAAIALNAAFALAAWFWAKRRRGAGLPRIEWGWRLSALLLAAVALTSFFALRGGDLLRSTDEEEICLGTEPAVCAPESGVAVARVAERGLHSAIQELAGSGLTWQSRYVMAHGDNILRLAPGTGILRVSPDEFKDGAMSPSDVALTLAMPRMCAAFVGEAPPEGLLADQQVVAQWIQGRLTGQNSGRAPDDIARAYGRLSDCPTASLRP